MNLINIFPTLNLLHRISKSTTPWSKVLHQGQQKVLDFWVTKKKELLTTTVVKKNMGKKYVLEKMLTPKPCGFIIA